jgi:hypothetical protein
VGRATQPATQVHFSPEVRQLLSSLLRSAPHVQNRHFVGDVLDLEDREFRSIGNRAAEFFTSGLIGDNGGNERMSCGRTDRSQFGISQRLCLLAVPGPASGANPAFGVAIIRPPQTLISFLADARFRTRTCLIGVPRRSTTCDPGEVAASHSRTMSATTPGSSPSSSGSNFSDTSTHHLRRSGSCFGEIFALSVMAIPFQTAAVFICRAASSSRCRPTLPNGEMLPVHKAAGRHPHERSILVSEVQHSGAGRR